MPGRWTVGVFLLVGLAGCSQNDAHRCGRCAGTGEEKPVVEVLPAPTLQAGHPQALLFDRRPGWYSATDFNWRSDWPSGNAYYAPGEAIYYHERFIDYQGPGRSPWNGTYRRFSSHRVGMGYR